jgi:hypothetical protein
VRNLRPETRLRNELCIFARFKNSNIAGGAGAATNLLQTGTLFKLIRTHPHTHFSPATNLLQTGLFDFGVPATNLLQTGLFDFGVPATNLLQTGLFDFGVPATNLLQTGLNELATNLLHFC